MALISLFANADWNANDPQVPDACENPCSIFFFFSSKLVLLMNCV